MKHSRRKIKGTSLTVPERTVSLRDLMDRSVKGLPINTRLREHKPLPPDGADEEDFETGTAEYKDLNDVYELQQRIEEKLEEHAEKTEKAKKEKEDKAFSDAVDAEIKRRESEKITTALNNATA